MERIRVMEELVKKYEVKVAINYAALSLFQCMLGMLLLSHWFACVWYAH